MFLTPHLQSSSIKAGTTIWTNVGGTTLTYDILIVKVSGIS